MQSPNVAGTGFNWNAGAVQDRRQENSMAAGARPRSRYDDFQARRVHQLELDVMENENELTTKNNLIDDLQAQIQELHERIDTRDYEVASLRTELEQKCADTIQVEYKHHNSKTHRDTTEMRVLKDSCAELKGIYESIKHFVHLDEGLAQDVERIAQEVCSLREEVQEYETLKQSTSSVLRQLKDLLDNLKPLKAMKREWKDAKADVKELNRTINYLEDSLAREQETSHSYKLRAGQSEEKVDELTQKVQDLQLELSNLKSKQESAEALSEDFAVGNETDNAAGNVAGSVNKVTEDDSSLSASIGPVNTVSAGDTTALKRPATSSPYTGTTPKRQKTIGPCHAHLMTGTGDGEVCGTSNCKFKHLQKPEFEVARAELFAHNERKRQAELHNVNGPK